MGKFKYVDGELAGKDYLMGKQFSVADGYHVHDAVMGRTDEMGSRSLSNLMAYKARVGARPKVQEALDQGRPDEGGMRRRLHRGSLVRTASAMAREPAGEGDIPHPSSFGVEAIDHRVASSDRRHA